MKLKHISIFFLFSVLSFSAASNLSLTTSLDASGNADVNAKIAFDQDFGKPASLFVSGTIDGATAMDASGLSIPVNLSRSGNMTRISVNVPSDYIEIDFQTPYLTTKTGSDWRYSMETRFSENVSRFSSILSLPPGSKISTADGAVDLKGGALSVTWATENLSTAKKADMFVVYTIEPQASDYSYLLLLAVVFIIGVAIYLYLSRNKDVQEPMINESKPTFNEDKTTRLESNPVFKTLDENDKEIVREIVLQGGKTTQSHLYLQTHIAKATLSRRLVSLESKGIISRSQKGIRKLISLTDLFKD